MHARATNVSWCLKINFRPKCLYLDLLKMNWYRHPHGSKIVPVSGYDQEILQYKPQTEVVSFRGKAHLTHVTL